jgi:hypothetical protein
MLVYLLCVHWIADFVLQLDWMATNKSKSLVALSAHVLTYTVFLCIMMMPYVDNVVLFALINGCLHFCIDFITSKITSYLWSQNDRHHFFVTIGFDQWLHNVCLITTLSYFSI